MIKSNNAGINGDSSNHDCKHEMKNGLQRHALRDSDMK